MNSFNIPFLCHFRLRILNLCCLELDRVWLGKTTQWLTRPVFWLGFIIISSRSIIITIVNISSLIVIIIVIIIIIIIHLFLIITTTIIAHGVEAPHSFLRVFLLRVIRLGLRSCPGLLPLALWSTSSSSIHHYPDNNHHHCDQAQVKDMSWIINIEDVQLSIISLIRIIEDDQNYQYYQYVSGASTLSEQLILVEQIST